MSEVTGSGEVAICVHGYCEMQPFKLSVGGKPTFNDKHRSISNPACTPQTFHMPIQVCIDINWRFIMRYIISVSRQLYTFSRSTSQSSTRHLANCCHRADVTRHGLCHSSNPSQIVVVVRTQLIGARVWYEEGINSRPVYTIETAPATEYRAHGTCLSVASQFGKRTNFSVTFKICRQQPLVSSNKPSSMHQ
jgi:hypothetical protein